MSERMKVRVFGTPIPQGSTKAFALRKHGVPTGRVVVTSDNPRTKPWRQAVIDAWHGAGGHPLNGDPVMVTVAFLMPRPKGHYGTGRNAGQVRPGAPAAPDGKPDIDKLCRSVLDALTDAGAWLDDAQVCSLHAIKAYPGPGEPPGAIIEVTPYLPI